MRALPSSRRLPADATICSMSSFWPGWSKERVFTKRWELALLAGKFPRMRLLIAGDGEEYANVKLLVERSGLEGIVMTGYVQNQRKTDILARSSVYLLPSYSEGLPISLVEAMAMGLPVVTRSVGGIKDFFVQGKHGFTTESKDPAVFAEFISELYENQDLYREISRHNYAYAKRVFAGSQVRQRMELIYRKIVEK